MMFLIDLFQAGDAYGAVSYYWHYDVQRALDDHPCITTG